MNEAQQRSLAVLAECSAKVQGNEHHVGVVVLLLANPGTPSHTHINASWTHGFQLSLLGAMAWAIRRLQDFWMADAPGLQSGKAEIKN